MPLPDPTWAVTLDDRTLLRQGDGVLFADLPYDRVRRMTVIFGPHCHTVDIAPGQRPVYFSKTQIRLNPENGNELGRRRIVCVGWQATVRGVNVKALSWLLDDGSVIHAETDPGEW